jgi:glycosyltransferase involved in cell wall biosynthesis
MPRFTIVTATRGRPGTLREALRSALEQDFGDFEHLVVDDASPDGGAAQVVRELGDPRIRLLRLPESRGPAGARNAALAEAKGDLVAVLDDDDAMLEGRLRLSAGFLDRSPDHVLVAGAFDAIDDDGTVHATVRPPTDERRIRAVLPFHNPFCHSTVTVRRDVLRALGGWREALRYSHDYDMVLRAAERGRVAILGERLGLYRFHARNISAARCFLQGAYAAVAQRCAERRAVGDPERLEALVAAVRAADGEVPEPLARARVHYQIGEWKFRDGRVREARPHLAIALRAEPLRPLCLALSIAARTPAWLRRLLGPVVRPLVAMRYPSWR